MKNKVYKKKSQLGAALLEVIVAIGIVTLVMTTIVSLVTVSLKSASLAQSKSLGTKYSQEGLESIRQMRNVLGWDTFLATLQADGTTIHYCLPTVPSTATDFSNLQNAACNGTQFVDQKSVFTRQADITITTNGTRTSVAITVTTTWNDSGFQKQSTVNQQFEEYNLADAPVPVIYSPLPYGYGVVGWTHRKLITVANSSGAAQTDFQVPVVEDTATLISSGKMLSSCNDIRLTAADSTTLLAFWIEPGTCNTAATKIWVKVPTVAVGNTSVYLFYGNPAASASTYLTTDVFIREIANVVGAWNMEEPSWNGTAGEVIDSSGKSEVGTSACSGSGCTKATTAAGLFGSAGNFTNDGTKDNYVTIPDKGATDSLRMNGTKNLTVSGWINSSLAKLSPVFSKYDSVSQGYILYVATSGKVVISFNGDTERHSTSTAGVTANTWAYVTAVYSGGNTLKLYANGVLKDTFSIGSGSLNDYSGTATIGTVSDSIGNTSYSTPGKLDNVRVYSGALTAAEISDEYGAGVGTREGYVTLNYPGKELIRLYSAQVTNSLGSDEAGSWTGL